MSFKPEQSKSKSGLHDFQKRIGETGADIVESFYGARAPQVFGPRYEGQFVVPPSPAQLAMAERYGTYFNPIDFSPLRRAANANFQSQVREALPDWMASERVRSGYGSDLTQNISDTIAERGLALEQYLTGAEIESENQRMARGAAYLPQQYFAADPMQDYQQRLADARYQDWLKAADPAWMAMLLGAIPTQGWSKSSSSGPGFGYQAGLQATGALSQWLAPGGLAAGAGGGTTGG